MGRHPALASLLIAWATFAIVLVVVRMARRILHAIDLAFTARSR